MERRAGEGLARHPSVAAAQASRDRAQLELRRARLEPYPDVKVGVAGGRIGGTDQSIIQLGFSVPLPIIDRGKGRQQEARANVSVAEAELSGDRATAVARVGQREQALPDRRRTGGQLPRADSAESR